MGEAERVFAARRHLPDDDGHGPDRPRTAAPGPSSSIPSATRRIEQDDLLLYGLEIAASGGHWVEFSRPVLRRGAERRRRCRASRPTRSTSRRRSATMKAGASAHDVHTAVSKRFLDRGFKLGHVTGHSIGMTMIEFPRVGEGIDVELRENMVISMHPHAITEDERTCLYMQDTWLRHAGRRGAVLGGADPDLPAGGVAVNGLDFFVEAVPPSLAVAVRAPGRGGGLPDRVVPGDRLRRLVRPGDRDGDRDDQPAARHRRRRHLEPLAGDDGAPGGVRERALGRPPPARPRRPGAELRLGLARPHLRAADPRDARVPDDPPAGARGRAGHLRGRDLLRPRLPAADAAARAAGAPLRRGDRPADDPARRRARRRRDRLLLVGRVRPRRRPAGARRRVPPGRAGRSTTSTSRAATRRSSPRTAAVSSRRRARC